jgi:ABC-type molybdate transport system substrate-binding protein
LADFLSFVVSQAGQKVLAEYGFLPPPGDTR